MKVRLTLVILLACLISRPLSAEIKIYYRLGDVDQTADIYQSKNENVYVDARSLPEKYRSRITINPVTFVKIDMRDVLSGRKVSEKGVVTYDQEIFARHDSDLYEIVKLKKFLDMNTVEDPSAQEKIKGAVEDFKHIGTVKMPAPEVMGTAEKPAPEVMDSVEKRLLMELDNILGVLDTSTKSELGEEISKAIDTYLVDIEKQKGTVLKAFDSAIKQQQSNGDLEKMKTCEAQKQSYIGGTLDAEQIADRTLKTSVKNYSKQLLSLQKSLLKDMNEEIKAQTKIGNVQAAEAITQKKKELLNETALTESTKVAGGKKITLKDFTPGGNWVAKNKTMQGTEGLLHIDLKVMPKKFTLECVIESTNDFNLLLSHGFPNQNNSYRVALGVWKNRASVILNKGKELDKVISGMPRTKFQFKAEYDNNLLVISIDGNKFMSGSVAPEFNTLAFLVEQKSNTTIHWVTLIVR